MFELTLWLLFGLLIGWIYALLWRTGDAVKVVRPCLAGGAGAILGGAFYRSYGHIGEAIQTNAILSAIGGAIFLIIIVEFVRENKKGDNSE